MTITEIRKIEEERKEQLNVVHLIKEFCKRAPLTTYLKTPISGLYYLYT